MSHYITCMCNQSNETCTCNECLSVISVSSWVSAFFCLFVLCVCASAWEVGGGGGGLECCLRLHESSPKLSRPFHFQY